MCPCAERGSLGGSSRRRLPPSLPSPPFLVAGISRVGSRGIKQRCGRPARIRCLRCSPRSPASARQQPSPPGTRPSPAPTASNIVLLVVILVVVVIFFDLCLPLVAHAPSALTSCCLRFRSRSGCARSEACLVVRVPRSISRAYRFVGIWCLGPICRSERKAIWGRGDRHSYTKRESSLCNWGLSLWMGEPLADFSAEGVSSSSCLCCNTSEKPGCEHSYASCKDGQDNLVVEEIGMALTEVMQTYGNEDNDEGSDLDEDSSNDDDDPVLSMESDSTDDFVDIDSELVISPASPSGDALESSLSKSVDDKSSIHCIRRLVSAMKGTRAKQGIMTKLSVSWAPDVYDPPVTSDSHTVRGHQRSSRKGHYKYKPSKSSSSRGSSGSKKDKKHSRHSSSSNSNNSKKDRKHSHRSANSSGSNRTDTSSSHYHKAHSGGGISSIRTVTCVPESAKVSPLVLAESAAALPEIVPVLKAMEPIKCATSCGKEKPFALLSRQFSPAKYKGMFSFWSQNQLAS